MDSGRYGHPQGWDNNSAQEGYGGAYEPNYRAGGSYEDRRFVNERNLRNEGYMRNAFDNPHHAAMGGWPQSRRRSYEEDYHPLDREPRRHDKPYRDSYHELDSYQDLDKFQGSNHNVDNYHDQGYERHGRFGGHDCDDYAYDEYDLRHHLSRKKREESHERDYEYGRHSYDSDYDRSSRRDDNWRRRESRDREHDRRDLSQERDHSPRRRHEYSRSRSRSRVRDDRSRSRSPRGIRSRSRSRSRSRREDSYDDARYERSERWRDLEDKHLRGHSAVAPSATVVVKGLSLKTTEEDLYQILAEWGPLRHVRVIKERNSGISRGFAFIDFPSVDSARAMMDKVADDGLVVDGRNLFFEYSSKPTSEVGGPFSRAVKSGYTNHRSITLPSDWMCIICGCVNFARRTSCFQCNEPRTDDAPAADIAFSNVVSSGKKGFESGPTHVLVVRGLDENADEDMLRYEFSKHAPIKDLRLVRDKFTHVSRGFAFVHFHTVEDATRALEATNGTTLERNGQILRVAYAKSIVGSGSGAPGSSQSSSLAAAAIEAAAFAQQYDAVGWAPKEYIPDQKQNNVEQQDTDGEATGQNAGSAPQSGFVWDEASGYYYDAASGFYYDGNTGLYYDGNTGVWYSYNNQTQQYLPCTDQNDNKTSEKTSESSKQSDNASNKKAVISAPATISSEKAPSLPDAVQAAATAALAAEKKEKEKLKEIKLASKSSLLANKKKMNNVLTMWKQRSHEGQATRVALDDSQPSGSADERPFSAGQSMKSKSKPVAVATKENTTSNSGIGTTASSALTVSLELPVKPRPVSNTSGGSLMGVIRGSGRGVTRSDTSYPGSAGGFHSFAISTATASVECVSSEISSVTPFRTDASALGSYASPAASGGKRRFSEMPLTSVPSQKEQPQTTYRDRAAERRSLYGSSSAVGDDLPDTGYGGSNRDFTFRKSSLDPTPFPPGVGGCGAGDASSNAQTYEVIAPDKAIDESNVGNRMLRNMGWQEGSGLGKDGGGMIEPVQAQAVDRRAGLGSQQKKLDPSLEAQAGDSYKTLIHKKALARFREMSESS